MTTNRQAERGFTLLEVLVVLVIVGVLAAFVMPDIINRSDDAEPARVAGDLSGVSEAITAFRMDTRNAFPGDLEDLAHRVTHGGTDADVEGQNYLDRHNARWNGAYLKAALDSTGVATATSDKMKTGYDGFILNPLYLWNSKKSNADNVSTPPTACGDNVFVTLRVQGLTEDEFKTVNVLVDGDDESTPGTQGNLRYVAGSTGDTGDTYYLATSCS